MKIVESLNTMKEIENPDLSKGHIEIIEQYVYRGRILDVEKIGVYIPNETEDEPQISLDEL